MHVEHDNCFLLGNFCCKSGRGVEDVKKKTKKTQNPVSQARHFGANRKQGSMGSWEYSLK